MRMKWLNADSATATAGKQNAEEKGASYTVRFRLKEQKRRDSVLMNMSKDILKFAEAKSFTHLRFGYNEETKQVGMKFNKKQGIELIDENQKYRNQLNVTSIYFALKEQNIVIPVDQTINVELEKSSTFTFSITEGTEASSGKPEQAENNEAGQEMAAASEVKTSGKSKKKTEQEDGGVQEQASASNETTQAEVVELVSAQSEAAAISENEEEAELAKRYV